jgi:hypothetical protein
MNRDIIVYLTVLRCDKIHFNFFPAFLASTEHPVWATYEILRDADYMQILRRWLSSIINSII